MSMVIDITRFNLMLEELAAKANRPAREVLRAEVGSILKQWAGYTKVAKRDISDRRARKKATHEMRRQAYGANKSWKIGPGESYINWGSGKRNALGTGGIWWRARNDKSGRPVFVPIQTGAGGVPDKRRNRKAWPSGVQEAAAIHSQELPNQINLARGAAGLARQSVIQIADAIGIKLEDVKGAGVSAAGIRKARLAMASNGKAYVNGHGKEFDNAKGTVIEILNKLPYNRKAGMDKGLQRAIVGRTRFFERNLANGVFGEAAAIAKKYPNIITAKQIQ